MSDNDKAQTGSCIFSLGRYYLWSQCSDESKAVCSNSTFEAKCIIKNMFPTIPFDYTFHTRQVDLGI